MFSDEVLETIFSDERAQKVPIVYQSIMTKVIEDAVDKENEDKSDDN